MSPSLIFSCCMIWMSVQACNFS